ncbi:MAG: D-alanyl-D-alanine carboxypeptidase [Defluviitaleaceae bacterium]|nr:D-alanyl-D-alanine carboxypeptidase [Defluviitaleaceae bacterium]
MIKKILACFFAIILIIPSSIIIASESEELHLNSESAILIEVTTGNVLFEKNADVRMYPASVTKIVTALVMLDYIDVDEVIITGVEVQAAPLYASRAGHQVLEHITGLNLVRALMLPSGNDTAHTVALNVARRHSGNHQMPLAEAEVLFAELMNQKARSLGAVNSNFVNPHGLHDDEHFSTARDLALISMAVLENEVLASVVQEFRFEGFGAILEDETLRVQEYLWHNTNSLISSTAHFYPYTIGIKTGFTTPAGFCLAAAAEKDGKRLVSVVLGAEERALRYDDTIALFNYGFDNFNFLQIQHSGEIIGKIELNNPPLGLENTITVSVWGEFSDFLSDAQFERIEKNIIFNEDLYEICEEDGETKLFTLPIEEGQVMGQIFYHLDGTLLFSDYILADTAIFERTFQTDFTFYRNFIRENAFTLAAVPYWIGLIGIIIFIINIIIKIRRRRKRKKRHSYRLNSRKRNW